MKIQSRYGVDWLHLPALVVPTYQITVLLGSTLALLAAGSAKAATFTVNYSGEITGVSDFSLLTDDELKRVSEEDPFPVGSRAADSPSYRVEQVPKPPSEATRLEGSYTYTDETNELLSSEFRFITPSDVETVSFVPEFSLAERELEEQMFADFMGGPRGTTTRADANSASYSQETVSLRTDSDFVEFFVDSQQFSYATDFIRASEFNIGGTRAVGVINQFAIAPQSPTEPFNPANPTETPTDPTLPPDATPPTAPVGIPEPSSVLGLTMLAGLGLVRWYKR